MNCDYKNTTSSISRAATEIIVAYAARMSEPWETVKTTWGEFGERLKQAHAPIRMDSFNRPDRLKKQLPAFFGGSLRGASRVNTDVRSRSLMVLDSDCGNTLDYIRERLAGYEYAIYPTISHLKTKTLIDFATYKKLMRVDDYDDEGVVSYLTREEGYPETALKNIKVAHRLGVFDDGLRIKTIVVEHGPIERYRIVILLAKQFCVEDRGGIASATRAWERASEVFIKKLGLRLDMTCCEIGRGFYVPTVNQRGEAPIIEHVEGTPLDLDAIIAELPPEEPRRASGAAPGKGLPGDYQDVLDAIPADAREVWLRVGMGLHHATDGGDEGFAIWHTWASKSPKNDIKEDEKAWHNFDGERDRQVTWASVEHMAGEHGWKRASIVQWPDIDGRRIPVPTSIPNIEAAMEHLGVGILHDEFADVHVLAHGGGNLDDSKVRKLWLDTWLLGLKVKKEFFLDTLLYISEQDRRHPVREYLDTVQRAWDGKSRIDRLLIDYAGAEDTPFNAAVGAIWMKAAVRRVRQPGCKFDPMLVLESAEGSGKSTFGAILANGWFSDCLPIDADPREVIEQTRGKWIIEFAELKGIRSKEVEGVKAFLSRREDSARAAYGRIRSDVLRQFVTMGSTNETTYLIGTTGNRRFWPVSVGKVDLVAISRDRDQLWAEAAVREAAGESIVLPESLWGVAKVLQDNRRLPHPLEEKLIDEVGDRVGIIAREHLYAAIGLSADNIYKASAQHGSIIKAAMERLGWKQTRKRMNGKMTSIYHRGDSGLQWIWAGNRFLEVPGQAVKHPAGRAIEWEQAASMH